MGRRKSFLSKFFFTPIKQELGGAIKRGVKRRTKFAVQSLAMPRGKVKISVAEALEFDRKRFRLKRR